MIRPRKRLCEYCRKNIVFEPLFITPKNDLTIFILVCKECYEKFKTPQPVRPINVTNVIPEILEILEIIVHIEPYKYYPYQIQHVEKAIEEIKLANFLKDSEKQ